MNEPDKLHLGDWFAAWVAFGLFIGSGIVAWIGSWIKERRTLMRERFEKIESSMSDINKQLAQHDELLAVADAHMANIKQTMSELKDMTKEQTKLLHDIIRNVRA